MIDKTYIKAKEIIGKPSQHLGIKVEYQSPKSDMEADRWGDYMIAMIYRITGNNILRLDKN